MVSALRARGTGIRTPFFSGTPIPSQSLVFVPTVQREGTGPRPHFHPRPCLCSIWFCSLYSELLLPAPRPPDPFSEDSASEVPSPPYLVYSPSSPPLGQPGRYFRRHLGSGRRGRGPRHRAEPLAGKRRGPAAPGLLAQVLATCTVEKLAGVSEESQNPDLPLYLTVSLRGSTAHVGAQQLIALVSQ